MQICSLRWFGHIVLLGLSALPISVGCLANGARAEDGSAEVGSVEAGSADIKAPADTKVPPMQLRLKNYSFGLGQLVASQQEGCLGWLNQGFTEPFQFELGSIRSLSRSHATNRQAGFEENTFLIETRGGETFVGTLVSMDEQWLTVRSELLGAIRLHRERVVSIVSVGYSGEIVYSGLRDSAPWDIQSNQQDWDIKAGSLTANRQGAALLGRLNLPARCEIDLTLAWKGVPDFSISLGVNADQPAAGQWPSVARLEVWNRHMVLVREIDQEADLVRLAELSERNPQIELTVLLDQVAGLVVVRDLYGRQLGRLELRSKQPEIQTSLLVVNHGPTFSLERCEVRSWDGVSLLGSGQGRQVVLRDGGNLDGKIAAYDAQRQMLTIVGEDDQSTEVAAGQLSTGSFQLPTRPDQQSKAAEAMGVEVVLVDHSRLRGTWLPSQDQKIRFRSAVLEDELALEPEHVSGVVGTDDRYTSDLTVHRNGQLLVGESELSGFLVEHTKDEACQTLRWQPHGSRASGPLQPEAVGRIAFRHQLPVSSTGQPTGRLTDLLSGELAQQADPAAVEKNDDNSSGKNSLESTREILFASGDSLDAHVDKIDEKGVYFRSNQTQVTFVEHSQISSLWLNSLHSTVKQPASEKLRNLTTIPRVLKNDPPTQLIVSVSGDYLRGRLSELTSDFAAVELRRESVRIPRVQIAQVIWLHDRDWQQSDAEPGDLHSEAGNQIYRIHVVQHARSITLSPDSLHSGVLRGSSPLLGDCSVPLKEVHQILFGPQLESRIRQFRENPWGLSLARLPKAFTESSDTDDAANQSPLLGKSAPRFSLIGLSGQPIVLKDFLGKVVVLEFWASWCGPCMQLLPEAQRIVSGYDSAQVQLVSINVQESLGRVQTAIDKLNLTVQVALDRDGEVAKSYLAEAIPHTIVIDAQGQVRHVLSGGRSGFSAQLKLAIDQLLGGSS